MREKKSEKESVFCVFTWSMDDVWGQEFGPFLLIALLCNVTWKRSEEKGTEQNISPQHLTNQTFESKKQN